MITFTVQPKDASVDLLLAAVLVAGVPVLLIVAMMVASIQRRSDPQRRPGRHVGAYIPRKDRPVIRGATDHNACSEFRGKSKRFPELDRTP